MTRKNNNDKWPFVFYDSFLEAMKHLNDVEFRECVLKTRDYALEGIEDESEYPMVNVIMSLRCMVATITILRTSRLYTQ